MPSAVNFYSAEILERREISDDLWIIRVDPGGDFRFLPGQYATLGVAGPDKTHERPYSIVSAPHEKSLEFFIELVPQGDVTPRLHACGIGAKLTLRPTAKGKLLLDLSGGRTNHLLLATVTGVSPFVSYVRALCPQWKDAKEAGGHRLFLMEGASRSWELGYREELVRTAGEVSWLTYVPTVSRPWDDKGWSGEVGRVDDLIRKYTDLWGLTPENTTVYLCGHPAMIENARGIVKRRGWSEDAVKHEAFFVAGNQSSGAPD
jgi:ferredoxin--NADP+ reductase